MQITKREIIFSILIVAVMVIIGFFVSDKISDWKNDKNVEYQKAIHIEDSEMFRYGMDTNVGNAFVYGELKSVDTVSYPEIEGEYIFLEKVKEKYTKHTRKVKHTKTVDGKTKTYYTTETYWTWDRVGSEELSAKEIEFCGIVFPISRIDVPSAEYIDTIKESRNIRYKYYGTGTNFKGTIFTELRDGTISEGTNFIEGKTIEQALKTYTSGWEIAFFWIVWAMLICAAVWGFYYVDNRWLE